MVKERSVVAVFMHCDRMFLIGTYYSITVATL